MIFEKSINFKKKIIFVLKNYLFFEKIIYFFEKFPIFSVKNIIIEYFQSVKLVLIRFNYFNLTWHIEKQSIKS